MKKVLSSSLICITMFGAFSSFADTEYRRKLPNVYPFKPMTLAEIYGDIEKVTEDKNFIRNFNDIVKQKLSHRRTKVQPWTASYWPLAKGTIADPYEQAKVPYYVDFARLSPFQWKSSLSSFEKRKRRVLSKIDSLSSAQLKMLAPSEKYDLLMGDKTFDLTRRLMTYMKDYGRSNQYAGFQHAVLAPVEDSANDSLKYAALSMKWNNYKNYYEAFKKDEVLNSRLDVKYAIQLVDSGAYPDVRAAMSDARSMAMKEKKNYVMADGSRSTIAAWEGICNGWSTAAGLIPRPKKAFSIRLPDGRVLPFYPSDVKGLVSLFWVNSVIQNNAVYNKKGDLTGGGTILIGNRCNTKKRGTDQFGRYYDRLKDPSDKVLTARCVGVHPAKWHLGLVNLIGKQGRSFIVERKVGHEVDNHPMSHYKMTYFNPYTGRSSSNVNKSIERITRRDHFRGYRHPKARYIVGVQTIMSYMDYKKPVRRLTDSTKYDKIVNKKMYYDLELDSNFNIVGGQWKTSKKPHEYGDEDEKRHNRKQPDFFWTVSKQWKKSGLFDNDKSVSVWKNKSRVPPRSWNVKAKAAHAYKYKNTLFYGTAKPCKVKNKRTGKVEKVFCEYETNRPQPFINVVNGLLELSQ